MNVNCPRDPLVCKCDYHLGVIPPGVQLRPPPLPETPTLRRFEYLCPNCMRPVAYGPPRADTCICSEQRAVQAKVEAYRAEYPDYAALWPTDAAYAARARFNARLASRACCRAHGTTCPACRAWEHRAPRLLVRLRDLLDALRAWCRHG